MREYAGGREPATLSLPQVSSEHTDRTGRTGIRLADRMILHVGGDSV